MIISRMKIVVHEETSEADIRREVHITGNNDEISRDLKAVGYALAKNARKRNLTKPKETAERVQFEQALSEGFRMDADEASEMDRSAAEEIADRMEKEFGRALS
jgi:hypothetical protein